MSDGDSTRPERGMGIASPGVLHLAPEQGIRTRTVSSKHPDLRLSTTVGLPPRTTATEPPQGLFRFRNHDRRSRSRRRRGTVRCITVA